eukprot:GAHX01002237.1.p1 GENE.GAHX01002237.1~~GAHX01002237.1.p1  ORF type:complete len:185 (+),score=32.40 GAHX01002237.1:41-595(+)
MYEKKQTHKQIAKRVKSQALPKQDIYCFYCEKQFRDKNGFECHLSTNPHKNALLKHSNDPTKLKAANSKLFKKQFLELLFSVSVRKVKANAVYQQFIRNKRNCRLIGTKWNSFNGFVYYLERCNIIKTEKINDELCILLDRGSKMKELIEKIKTNEQTNGNRNVLDDTIIKKNNKSKFLDMYNK